MKLIVGLGNPGKNYDKTRHNVGFNILDILSKKYDLHFVNNKKFNAMEDSIIILGEKVIFIKPLSYMNLSGDVVLKYVSYYDISSDNILVIQDDLDMELGKIRVLFDSSSLKLVI